MNVRLKKKILFSNKDLLDVLRNAQITKYHYKTNLSVHVAEETENYSESNTHTVVTLHQV